MAHPRDAAIEMQTFSVQRSRLPHPMVCFVISIHLMHPSQQNLHAKQQPFGTREHCDLPIPPQVRLSATLRISSCRPSPSTQKHRIFLAYTAKSKVAAFSVMLTTVPNGTYANYHLLSVDKGYMTTLPVTLYVGRLPF